MGEDDMADAKQEYTNLLADDNDDDEDEQHQHEDDNIETVDADNQGNNTTQLQAEDVLANHLEISVAEAEKRANGSINIREFYTVYLIETKVTDLNWYFPLQKLSSVWRRYSEFEQLREYLEITYPYVVVPPLPEKRVLYTWKKVSTDTFDPDFIDRRRAGLENFMLRVSSHPNLGRDKHFVEFLQLEDTWRENSKAIGYIHLAENKLKALSVSVRLKSPDRKFESIKHYGQELQTNMGNLLRSRAKVVERNYVVHKLHANYGRLFSEWSAIEKEMGDALQKSGHYLDSLASSISAALEDEEMYADQFKEYLFFANALMNVCRKQETLQLRLEGAEDNVIAKNTEKTKALQGKSSLMSRLFGAVDTEEVREFRVNVLDQKIQEGEIVVCSANKEIVDFSNRALADIEKWQLQKDIDLKETLTAYSLLQLKSAKKGLQTWTQVRDCLLSIC